METADSSIGKRMRELRLNMKMTQAEISVILQISDKYYSRLERDVCRLSYDNIVGLHDNLKWDINYILTGREVGKSVFDKYLFSQPREVQKKLTGLVLWTIRIVNIESDTKQINTLISYWAKSKDEYGHKNKITIDNGLLKLVRDNMDLSQKEMAELLEIDVRKYGKLERGEIRPTLQSLLSIDRKLGYSPSFVLFGEINSLPYINEAWNNFSDDVKRKIVILLENGIQLVDC